MRKLRLFLHGRLFPCALLALAVAAAGVAIALWLPRALAPLAAAERAFSLAAGIVVAAGKGEAEYKTARLLLLLLLPWTGAVLCLCSLPKRGRAGGRLPCTVESAEYFPLGADMIKRLLRDIAGAKRAVWLQYYIVAEGTLWDEIFSLLKERAAAGVDVRVLYDDFGSALTLPADFEARLARSHIAARALRKVNFPSLSMGRREHRKIAAIDFTIAYTGGVNLADEYVGKSVRFGHWKDTALRLTGTAALALSSLFAETWGGDTADMVPPFSAEGESEVFFDFAEEGMRCGAEVLPSLIGRAEQKAYLFTPYLAPDGALLRALAMAAKRADVRLMIPHIPDKKLPFLLSRSYARDLLALGVQVREYTPGFLHAKSVLADGVLSVSSYNLDFRSFYLQSECGVLVKDGDAVAAAERDFLCCWEQGTPVPKQSLLLRFAASCLRLFAPLM